MLEKVFLLALAVIVVADASTFKESLLKNVNRYKQNNFEWNIRNLNAENFVSLRKIENRKDREFKAYLQQLRGLNHGNALDAGRTMQYITEEQRNEEFSPREMPYKIQTSSLDVQNKRQKSQGLNRKDLHVMMYGKKIAPQSMCYGVCESNDQEQATGTSNARNERFIMSMMYNEPIPDILQALLANNENNTLLQQLLNLTLYGSGQQPQDMLYNSRPSRDHHHIHDIKNPDHDYFKMNSDTAKLSQVTLYDNLQSREQPEQPKTMYQKHEPQGMMYSSKRPPQGMMYSIQQSRDVPERRFVYDETEHIDRFTPDIIDPPVTLDPGLDKNNNNKKRSLQSMLYSDKLTPQEMMYSAIEDSPQQMLYSNTRESNDNTPLSVHVMMYNAVEDSPQQMLYSNTRESIDNAPLSVHVMMYNGIEEDSPQQMLYSNTRESKISAPRAMQFVPDSELEQMSVMMYNGVDIPKYPSAMMYNAVEEDSPQQMLYSNTPESNDNSPQSMYVMKYPGKIRASSDYDRQLVQSMMYNGPQQEQLQPMMYSVEPLPLDVMYKTLDDSPQSMLYSNARDVKSKREYKKTPPKNINQENSDNRKLFMVAPNDRRAWYNRIVSLTQTVPMDEDTYFNKWTDTIALFGTNETARAEFKNQFPVLSLEEVLLEMASIKHLENLFWPFVFENGFMNQKLGLFGLSGMTTTKQDQKLAFYEALEQHQTIHIPATADKIVLSFNDESVVEGLNRSGLMETQKQYVDAGLHLFTPDEQEMISRKVNSALHLINSTMPQLYASISQVIGCIAYYKAQIPGFAGGSVSSSLGMIWQDPRAYREQSVAHYAEQIVHEFIHNSLFLADMVHGTFVDSQRVSQTKVYSPIRHELRDFDKTFHASYVSTGVALFHAKAGNVEKARKLLEPLEASVAGLVEINDQVGVLNESGNAMLQSMVDFLTVIRLI